MKVQLRERFGIDYDQVKGYGPRREAGGTCKVEEMDKRRDVMVTDRQMLRFGVCRFFNLDAAVKEFAEHLAWRQQNIPVPILNCRALATLNKGVLFLHGRTKDLSPILVIDIKCLATLLERKEIDAESFCMLHNFLSNYMINNMLTPGQVEKWIVIVNLNQYPVSQLPIRMFQAAN